MEWDSHKNLFFRPCFSFSKFLFKNKPFELWSQEVKWQRFGKVCTTNAILFIFHKWFIIMNKKEISPWKMHFIHDSCAFAWAMCVINDTNILSMAIRKRKKKVFQNCLLSFLSYACINYSQIKYSKRNTLFWAATIATL